MKDMLAAVILLWNSLLGIIGRSIGLFFGGLYVGFLRGIQDQKDMNTSLKYKTHMLKKKHKEKQDAEK